MELWAPWYLAPELKVVLMIIIFLGIMGEIKVGGIGVLGGIATIAAVALFGLDQAGEDASWLELVLFAVGCGLLAVELFVPGFGVFGIGGLLCVLASFYYILGANTHAMALLAIAIVGAVVLFALLVKYLHVNPAARPFILTTEQHKSTGYTSAPDCTSLLGKEGTALTVLRPSGTALIEGIRVDVVTQGEYVAQGAKVKVSKVEGSKIIVERMM